MPGEVFALNNLLVALILHLTVSFATAVAETRRQEDPALKGLKGETRQFTTEEDSAPQRLAYAGAAVFGLGCSHQHTVVLFMLPLVPGILFVVNTLIHADSRSANDKRRSPNTIDAPGEEFPVEKGGFDLDFR
jgi:hypothetical protein